MRAVFETGDRLVGDADEADRLRAELSGAPDGRPLGERMDNALAAIDDHLA